MFIFSQVYQLLIIQVYQLFMIHKVVISCKTFTKKELEKV